MDMLRFRLISCSWGVKPTRNFVGAADNRHCDTDPIENDLGKTDSESSLSELVVRVQGTKQCNATKWPAIICILEVCVLLVNYFV